jgi:hypothetical protein
VVAAPERLAVERGAAAQFQMSNAGFAWARWTMQLLESDTGVTFVPAGDTLLAGCTVAVTVRVEAAAKPGTVTAMVMGETQTFAVMEIEIR